MTADFTKSKKKKAQGILEFLLSFIFIVFFFVGFVEYAFWWQNLNANQAFSDDLNANFSLYNSADICATPNPEIVDLVNLKAQRYFGGRVNVEYSEVSENFVRLTSSRNYFGKPTLIVHIQCDDLSHNSTTTQSQYLYRGFLIFAGGYYVSSISSVRTPYF